MPTLRKPPPLHPGDRIGVIAPGSPPKSMEDLQAGIAYLQRLGYDVVTRRAFSAFGYLCGTDAERLDEFNAFLRDPDVKALFCARGGYGSLRLLPHLDYEAARQHPKLLVGYSDITALHCAFYQRAGLPGLSGPMVAEEWSDPHPPSVHLFWEMARGATPQPLVGPADETLQPVRPGTATGTLIGGNLSMIVRLIGTPFLPPLEGALLFVEEIGEAPYRIDALLAQLQLAGLLERLGGLILGAFTDWQPEHNRPTFTPDEVIAHYMHDLSFPIANGLVYGHFPAKNTLPFGVRARLEVTRASAALSILEPVVQTERDAA